MKWQGKTLTKVVKIDIPPLAEGMLGLFDADDAGPLALGMLPAKKMELMDNLLAEKFDEICAIEFGLTPEAMQQDKDIQEVENKLREMSVSPLSDDLIRDRKNLVSKVSHAVAVEIYRMATEQGRMVV